MFSIMIPCHDVNLRWLERTLESVLSQLNPASEQVTILCDHYLTQKPLRDLCASRGLNFVACEDEGGVAMHNRCIALAQEELVHILHPDDWTLGGFYRNVRVYSEQNTDVALYATGALWCHESGEPFSADVPLWLNGRNGFLPLHMGNPLCVAGCVVRRSAYDQYGGWDARLIHTCDWECWARMTTKGGAIAIHWPLACYRTSANNHTSRLARTADNLRDYLTMAQIASEYMPVDWPAFRDFVGRKASLQSRSFHERGDEEAEKANTDLTIELGRSA